MHKKHRIYRRSCSTGSVDRSQRKSISSLAHVTKRRWRHKARIGCASSPAGANCCQAARGALPQSGAGEDGQTEVLEGQGAPEDPSQLPPGLLQHERVVDRPEQADGKQLWRIAGLEMIVSLLGIPREECSQVMAVFVCFVKTFSLCTTYFSVLYVLLSCI